MSELLRLGTRGSRLALTQTQLVADALKRAHPQLQVEIVVIQTTGDKIADVPLSVIGGKGAFTREIEDALLHGRLDAAVHSLKDLPTIETPGLTIGAITARESPRDLLLAVREVDWRNAPLRVGTCSLRRSAEMLRLNPRAQILELRGNVPTRIEKLLRGDYDAIVLAAAGLARLGLSTPFIHEFTGDEMLPAPGQGALALQIRDGDAATAELIAPLHDKNVAAACIAERALLHALGGGCQLPVGSLGTVESGALKMRARVISLDGSKSCDSELRGSRSQPDRLGRMLAEKLLANGAAELLRETNPRNAHDGFAQAAAAADAMDALPLGGKTVLVTRDEDADGPLSRALRSHGANPIAIPMVRILPAHDPAPLQDAARRINEFDWIAITSGNAVAPLKAALASAGNPWIKIACIGAATARVAEEAGAKVSLIPDVANVQSLAAALLKQDAKRILYPCADIAAGTLVDLLRAGGAEIESVVAYRTEKTPARETLLSAFGATKPWAALFCSPSAVDSVSESLGDALRDFLAGVVVGSIGPRTTAALIAAGIRVDCEPEEQSFEALAMQLCHWLAANA